MVCRGFGVSCRHFCVAGLCARPCLQRLVRRRVCADMGRCSRLSSEEVELGSWGDPCGSLCRYHRLRGSGHKPACRAAVIRCLQNRPARFDFAHL